MSKAEATIGQCMEMVLGDNRVKKLSFDVGVVVWYLTGDPARYMVTWFMIWKGEAHGNGITLPEYTTPLSGIPDHMNGKVITEKMLCDCAKDFQSVYRELCAEDDQEVRNGREKWRNSLGGPSCAQQLKEWPPAERRGWISVTDEIPDSGVGVIALCEDGLIVPANMVASVGDAYWESDIDHPPKVTHWIPRPDLPSEGGSTE